jgi:hypothetical protein
MCVCVCVCVCACVCVRVCVCVCVEMGSHCIAQSPELKQAAYLSLWSIGI